MEVRLLRCERNPLGSTGKGFSSTMKINRTHFSSYACTKRWSRMCSSGSQVLYLQRNNQWTSPAFVILPKIHLNKLFLVCADTHSNWENMNKIHCSGRTQLLTWEAILSTWADTPRFPVRSGERFINITSASTTHKTITNVHPFTHIKVVSGATSWSFYTPSLPF